ncbi:tRNA 2-selenouridine(34) synthase MnmH [Pseudomonas sp. KNUC1026]|uniref:tRNA 2-selenouridine(34) synthase MnmH n=1 Tax=Pseudomonas sp. KNUC1026 TaxID=2893890 RepID=UPI001F450C54|nr:tRNA 2-selenouridine(34) synthase MnmH [Pseudomonas sp. KNUC1026]UFH51601.1 tRNA 2-selenouridine(34) synthase MnmH [Pseudomonas sp. KNUC1026]
MREDVRDFHQLFLNDTPMMDTRAPVEFVKGAFPGTINLPLMTDVERQKVGTCYKQQGQDAAIRLGHQLVCGEVKAQRVAAWAQFARNPPARLPVLLSWRPALADRPAVAARSGSRLPRVTGGYKAMRTFLVETLEQAVAQCDFVVLGGMTGTGKTEVLATQPNALDLEGHANHRGSSFGKRATGQPSQIDFENRLAIDILKKRHTGIDRFVLEDEARIVGSCNVPIELYQGMQRYPVIWLEDSFQNRVERILRDYVTDLSTEFVSVHGQEHGFERFAERLLQSLDNIHKRLGANATSVCVH